MRTFYSALANSLTAFLTNTFVWFAVTFWVYLETRSVIATAVMAGIYTSTVALSGFFLGSLVDRYPKKNVLMLSSVCSLVLYALAGLMFVATPRGDFTDAFSVSLWVFIVLSLVGQAWTFLTTVELSSLWSSGWFPRDGDFDIVLMDMQMPVMDGLTATREIRLHEAAMGLTRTPVVMLTSSGLLGDVVAGYELGANSYVQKPVDFLEFRDTVRLIAAYWLTVNEPPRRVR